LFRDFEGDFALGSDLLFDAAQVKTVMLSAPSDSLYACQAFASAQGLVCYEYDIKGV
jgi:hypothetical protein